jgi:hypothetical protein
MTAVEKNWKSWLFNPFKFVAGFKALIIGLTFIVAASLLGSLGSMHFDGVLDAHYGPAWPAWAFITEGLIDWLSLALVLAIFAAIMHRKTSRFIDVLGTQALARWPSLITAILLQIPAYKRTLNELVAKAQQAQTAPPTLNPVDMIILIAISILLLAAIIWMVALMWRAFAVSCNAKGPKAIIVFIIAIVISEIISKVLLFQLGRLIS